MLGPMKRAIDWLQPHGDQGFPRVSKDGRFLIYSQGSRDWIASGYCFRCRQARGVSSTHAQRMVCGTLLPTGRGSRMPPRIGTERGFTYEPFRRRLWLRKGMAWAGNGGYWPKWHGRDGKRTTLFGRQPGSVALDRDDGASFRHGAPRVWCV